VIVPAKRGGHEGAPSTSMTTICGMIKGGRRSENGEGALFHAKGLKCFITSTGGKNLTDYQNTGLDIPE